MAVLQTLLVLVGLTVMAMPLGLASHDYADALSKSILFFEGQRSGKLPTSQRMKWRKDSALRDGFEIGVDLVGGYYDAGDNVKFNFPMAFSTTMLAWSVLEFRKPLGPELPNALAALWWAADYILKATAVPGLVFVQVGQPWADHQCWERPEDMDTPRTAYAVSRGFPGSEVSAEIAAALAAAAMAFRATDRLYSAGLLSRAKTVFNFADKSRGSYNDSLGPWVCPFYCDFNGYQDELIWGAAWLYKATKGAQYLNYVTNNVHNLDNIVMKKIAGDGDQPPSPGGAFAEFGWDSKHAGINILLSKFTLSGTVINSAPFVSNGDKFVCSILPESPTRSVSYSPGGLLFKPGGSNLQHATALSFLLVTYSRYLNKANRLIHCGNLVVTPARLIQVAKSQVDYILGSNPMKMSYMVGYGKSFPQRIHHRGSSLPSKDQFRGVLKCEDGTQYFNSENPNHNLLIGAIVGGPDINDKYSDSRADFVQSEPTTYIIAPFVGVLAYFKSHPY